MIDETKARGVADPANRDTLDFSHEVALDDGRKVTVSEGSGVAFAEETGRAGFAKAKPWRDTRVRDEDGPPVPLLPILSVAAAAGIIAFALWKLRGHGPDGEAEIDFRPAPDL
jgi:hypothetical protein